MPRLFKEPDSIPGLTWPTLTFSDRLTIDLGGDRGDLVLQYCGRGHTEGDIVAWLPRQRILFAGDLVEAQAALYTGDAFHRDWATATLDGRRARRRGAGRRARRGRAAGGTRSTRRSRRPAHFLDRACWREVGAVHAARRHAQGGVRRRARRAARRSTARWPIFEHCLPFDVSRLWDELAGVERPRDLDRRARPRGLGRSCRT